jgi:hypothetical protein
MLEVNIPESAAVCRLIKLNWTQQVMHESCKFCICWNIHKFAQQLMRMRAEYQIRLIFLLPVSKKPAYS